MTSQTNKYTPVEHSTPTKASRADESPVTTPSRAALLKPNFLVRGSPIKFTLSSPERETLKDVEFEKYERNDTGFRVRRFILVFALWSLRIVLTALAIYLYISFGFVDVGRLSISSLRR
jgi:hypothetical protein